MCIKIDLNKSFVVIIIIIILFETKSVVIIMRCYAMQLKIHVTVYAAIYMNDRLIKTIGEDDAMRGICNHFRERSDIIVLRLVMLV